MNLAKGFAIVATFAVASSALADESVPSVVSRHVLARADTHAGQTGRAATLDEYAGCYETADGMAFIIVRDEDGLAIDLPEGWAFRESRLREDGSGGFFVAEPAGLVTFEIDAEGRVQGVVIHPSNGQAAIEAAKAPSRRGIVTIHDIVDSAPTSVTVASVN
jgi:uncharacterized protein DUF3471